MTVYQDRLILSPPPDYDGRLQTWNGSTALPLGEGPGASIDGTVRVLTMWNGRLIAAGSFTSAGGAPVGNIAVWNGSSWQGLGTGLGGTVYALAEYNGLLIAGGAFTTAGGAPANRIAAWDGSAWSPLGSGVDDLVASLATYHDDLVVGGRFTEAGGTPAYHMAVWSRQEALDVTLDVRPGSCTNPINPRAGNNHGKAVVPVAILGSADVDVRDIDPSSVEIGGAGPMRWHIADVATPADDADDDCACGEGQGDGYDDAVFMFRVEDVAAALEAGEARPVVRLTGALRDGTPIQGTDCVTLVGKAGGPQAAEGASGRGFELRDNVPNPFNPTTRITYYLPEATPVRLTVYDVLGRRVATLVDGPRGAGEHSVVWKADGVASGVYYCRIEAGRFTDTKRMVLLK